MASEQQGDEGIAMTEQSKATVVPLDEHTHLLAGQDDVRSRTNSGIAGGSLSRGGFSQSLHKLKSATLTVSLLEKPSDDRRASAFLAGWNVTNLIQGTGILGVPYAVRMGGWAAVAANALIALLCCYTGKLLIECLYEKSKSKGQVTRG